MYFGAIYDFLQPETIYINTYSTEINLSIHMFASILRFIILYQFVYT